MFSLSIRAGEVDNMDEFCGSRFWDSDVVWNTSDPDLTLCFEKTVLTWIPCAFLWICLPLEIYYLRHSKASNIPLNLYNVVKLISIAILATLSLADIVHHVFFHSHSFPVDFYSPLIKFITFLIFLLLTYANLTFGVRSSPILFLFSLLLVVFGAPQLRTELRSKWIQEENHNTVEFVSYVIYFPVVLFVFILNCFADSRPRIVKHKVIKNVCVENQSSFLSQLLFAWYDPFAWKGARKSLEDEDLPNLDYTKSSAGVVPQFEKYWTKAREKVKKNRIFEFEMEQKRGKEEFDEIDEYNLNKISKKKKFVSVVPVLCQTTWSTFLMGTTLKLIQDILVFVSPQILSLLIGFMSGDEPLWRGYFYAITLFAVAFIRTVILSQYFHKVNIVGLKLRISLISIIYKKALSISNGARREFTVGEIVNLMSVDAQRIVELMMYVNMLWSAPLQILLALFFLWQFLGPSVLAGFVLMIILIPINGYIASKLQKLMFKQMAQKDKRVKLMNEILSGIKVLKFYAWEPSFENQVLKIRDKENRVLKKQAYMNALIGFIWNSTPFLVSLLTFAVYALSSEEHVLDAKTVFVSLSLFNILRFPLMALPMMISQLAQASVSVKRINKFLNSEDLNPDDVSKMNRPEALLIENGSFSWEGTNGPATLRDINIKVNPGNLVAVVGPVGCGKSSLISAFLGEMYKLSGLVNTRGSIAYVPQQAWIQNTTLKNNITFGDQANNNFYNQVLEACALKTDLEILPAGDATEIGEKGINLSGGQKQRISLARAVYNRADVYLLDDPLSAVDSHVGKHIFDYVIGPNGLMKNTTRILVTHSITYLSQVDFIVVVKDGSISESGSFQELVDKKGDFSVFLDTYLRESSESDEEDMDDGFTKVSSDEKISSGQPNKRKSKPSESGSVVSFNRQKSTNESKESLRNGNTSTGNVAGEKLIEVEHSESGKVKWKVYGYYLKSFGLSWTFAILFMIVVFQVFSISSSMLLSSWSTDTKAVTTEGNQDISKRNFYLTTYALLGLGQATSTLLEGLFLASGMVAASRNLHLNMLNRILRAPLSFFDTTPSGRIINRFGKDVDIVDSVLPQVLRWWLESAFGLLTILYIITYSTPIFATIILPVGLLYYFIQRIYVATTRQLKRLNSVSQSSIYSHFSETISGAQSIRAYGLQEKFIKQSEYKVDFNLRSYYLNLVSNRWLSVRLETVGNIIMLFVAVLAVLGKDTLSPGLAALSITSVLSITELLNWVVNMTSEVETNIVSVERIKEYSSETPQEASWKLPNELVPKDWPSKGDIVFKNFQVRYRDGLDLVLKGITAYVDGGQKVGIVGRTGAGKSSLTLSLFRIIESAGGEISIDGVDIASLGLHSVRAKLTIIPQDPVLFSGSLRVNLDPAGEYSDDRVWRSLELAHLKSYVSSLAAGLEYEVTEGGENFSVGQRQLICLARALLRKTKVLILDEATAAVDLETDELIQTTIRSEFRDCTVLTIAHRLNTIMDYDKIMVLDKGLVVEYDSPEVLLKSKNSVFYGMAADAGLV
ncbi:multidrug resistance-associated protein 1-like [Planococcus citri]|uniref:multidrug resistance-associated protein 1-like n=1 Tax=Planococcus citri TaxID=170843 RepID=UPI0031F949C7